MVKFFIDAFSLNFPGKGLLTYPNTNTRKKRSTRNRKKRSVKGRFEESNFLKKHIRLASKNVVFKFFLNLLAACKTLDVETISNEECIFPFKYDGKYYDGCAWSCSNGGYYWCPTRVDKDKNYIGGYWGKCSSPCDISSENLGSK